MIIYLSINFKVLLYYIKIENKSFYNLYYFYNTIINNNMSDILCKDVLIIIIEYSKEYELLDWININKINWNMLSKNPNAIDMLMKNQDKINWSCLSLNPNAIDLLMKNQNKIDWWWLSSNPNIFRLLDTKYIQNNYFK